MSSTGYIHGVHFLSTARPQCPLVIPLRDDNPTRRKAIVTFVLIAVNVGIFLFWQRAQAEPEFLFRNAAIPCEVTSGSPIDIVEGRRGATLGCADVDRPLF